MTHRTAILTVALGLLSTTATADGVCLRTVVGSTKGLANGALGDARFSLPYDVEIAWDGTIYVLDVGNNVVRRSSTDGPVETFAGSGQIGDKDGPALQASFVGPYGLCTSAEHKLLFVVDTLGHTLRAVAADGTVTTIAGTGVAGHLDGPAGEARFDHPYDCVALPGKNVERRAGASNNRIRALRVVPMPTRGSSASWTLGESARGPCTWMLASLECEAAAATVRWCPGRRRRVPAAGSGLVYCPRPNVTA